MAKGDIEISIDANASGAIKGFKQTETAAQRAGNVVNKGAKIAAVGFAAVGVGALALAKGAADDQKAATALATTLKNTTGATKAQVAATEAWISKQGQLTGITDDELRPALSKLVASTHDVGKAQDLAKLAMDVSAGSGKDLQTVSAALAKAQNGNVGALSRLGIKTKESVKDNAALQAAQIRVRDSQDKYNQAVEKFGPKSKEAHLAAAKLEYAQTKLGEAQGKVKTSTIDAKEAMKRLADTYSGSAGKQAGTLAGKTKILQTQLSEAGETIGYALIPVLTTLANFAAQKVLPALQGVGKWMSDNKPIAIAIGAAIAAFGAAFIVASVALKVYSAGAKIVMAATKTWAAVQWALNAAMSANPIALVVLAIAALVVGLVIAYKKSETFRAIVDGAFRGIAAAASFMWDKVLKPVFKFWLNTWFTVIGAMLNGAAKAFGWVPGIGGKLKDAAAKFNEFRDDVNRALDGIHSVKEIHLNVTTRQSVLVSSINKPRVPHGATGGIVTRPTIALIGEAGPEAVVPLNRTPGSSPLPGGGLTIENLTINAAPNEPINSSLPRAIATLDLLYGAA